VTPTTGPTSWSAQLSAAAITRGAAYAVVVSATAGTFTAAAAPVPLILVNPPAGITGTPSTASGVSLGVSWTASPGATQYSVRVTDADSVVAFSQTVTATSVTATGPLLVAGATYAITVSASAGLPSPWSAPVSVTIPIPPLYTCLCLGGAPGGPCGNNGIGGDYTDVFLNVTQQNIGSFSPTRTAGGRTGWVAAPPGAAGELAVLAQLLAKLTSKSVLATADAFAVLMKSQPFEVRPGAGGPFTCLCLGTAPGGGCGNNGIGDNFSGVFTGVSQQQLDANFSPTRTAGGRTGWVAVGTADYAPLEVLLQLVTALAQHGTLTGTEPWDVFNNAMTARLSAGAGGATTCVALGAPVGQATTTMSGRFGDVVLDVTAAELPGYQAGPASGWAAVAQQPYSVLSALLQLAFLLAEKNILTGTQPYDIFNNATASRVITE
jgi:hypothetical protein